MLTLDEVIEEITESGLNLGAGDFVDVEVLKDAVKYLKAYKYILEVGDVAEAVKEAEMGKGWIPYSERLPEEDTRVLIVGKRGGVQIARSIECSSSSNGRLWISDNRKSPKPTHWMPIPEPPTDKENKQ